MSQITLSPNAAGAGIFTVAAPATGTNRTLTLPDQTGTLATSADVTAAAAAVQSMVFLGDLTTTSGTSQSLTGQNLSDYKFLVFDFNGVSHNAGTSQSYSIGAGAFMTSATAADQLFGLAFVSLWSGVITPMVTRNGPLPAANSSIQYAQSGYSTATTSVSVSVSGGAFDAGSIRVYGVK